MAVKGIFQALHCVLCNREDTLHVANGIWVVILIWSVFYVPPSTWPHGTDYQKIHEEVIYRVGEGGDVHTHIYIPTSLFLCNRTDNPRNNRK